MRPTSGFSETGRTCLARHAGAAAQRRRRSDDDARDEYPVSDIELASRLSYFLWASMPDAELMRVAKAGTLRQPAVLEAQVRRMMADPKGYNLVENWAAQWLQLRNLGRTKPDPKRFPTVDDELLDAMRKETRCSSRRSSRKIEASSTSSTRRLRSSTVRSRVTMASRAWTAKSSSA